jgi:hypothetical protein
MRLVKETWEVEDGCLTNTPAGQRHPRGKPFTFYLFAWRIGHFKNRAGVESRRVRREAVVLTAPTKAAAQRKVQQWVRRHRARVLSDRQARERLYGIAS